jgi:uncharacterized protein YdeI (YjbR/CyaY-like superfamily)
MAKPVRSVSSKRNATRTAAKPSTVRAPKELQALLRNDARAREMWESMTPARRKQLVVAIEEAASAETRARRLEKLISLLTKRDR